MPWRHENRQCLVISNSRETRRNHRGDTVKIFSLPTALEGDFSKAYEMACPEWPVVTVGNSTAVSVTERNPEGNAAPTYYNTSGQRLSVKPASGIVIERRGNRVVKRVGRN